MLLGIRSNKKHQDFQRCKKGEKMKRVNLKTLVLGFFVGVLCTLCVLMVVAQFSANSKKISLKPITMGDLKPYHEDFNGTTKHSVVPVIVPEKGTK